MAKLIESFEELKSKVPLGSLPGAEAFFSSLVEMVTEAELQRDKQLSKISDLEDRLEELEHRFERFRDGAPDSFEA
jgi:hypothetical protein